MSETIFRDFMKRAKAGENAPKNIYLFSVEMNLNVLIAVKH